MDEKTVNEIKEQAKAYATESKKWHFHILTPECRLNETKDYALVLENTTDGEIFVSYSNKPYMGVGEKLVKLLHGDDVMKGKGEIKEESPSKEVEGLLKRAKELMSRGVFWHHHMLFPGCKYNNHDNKWVIVFEDQEKGEVIESITIDEPKSDLQYIEGLFYSQKKI